MVIQQGNCTFVNHYGANIISQVGTGGTMRINGRTIDLSRLDEIAEPSKTTKKKAASAQAALTYKLSPDCSIRTVIIKSSGCLEYIHPDWLGKICTVNISGSGDVSLPSCALDMLSVNIAGSGDVRGDDTDVICATINIAGSGDVVGFHIEDSGSVSIMGSGDVLIRADDRNSVACNQMGSGNIRIR